MTNQKESMQKRTIFFNEELHKYTDEYNNTYTSVTQCISKVEPEYDTDFWAWYRFLDMKNKKPRPYLKERIIEFNLGHERRRHTIPQFNSGVIGSLNEVKKIKEDWLSIAEEACTWGTNKHNYLEHCIDCITNTKKSTIDIIPYDNAQFDYRFKVTNLKELESSPLQITYPKIYNLIKKYVLDGWVLYAEKRVYSSYHLIAGTIDLLLVRDNECYIIDWKTNRKPLKFESGYYRKEWNSDRTKKIETDTWVSTKDKFLNPLNLVTYSKGNIYTLQLSSYLYLCYLWGLKPKGATLVHIRPQVDAKGEIIKDNDGNRIEHEPELYEMPIWANEVKLLFQHIRQKNGVQKIQ